MIGDLKEFPLGIVREFKIIIDLSLTLNRKCGKISGLNIRGFSPIKFLRKYFRGALATSVYYLPIAKNSQKNFRGTLKNHKNRKSLAQQIFPRFTV